MNTINNNVNNEYLINKSKFICYLIKVDNISDIDYNLNYLKQKYNDATHICYAYIISNIKRFNDDNEPSGTAGMPILNVLENNNLNCVLAVVIRYFGGIKLGAGGLVRAYTKSVTLALDKTSIKKINKCLKISICFNYNETKLIDNLLKDINIIDKKYDDNIIYTFIILKDDFDKINNLLLINNIKIIKKEEVLF